MPESPNQEKKRNSQMVLIIIGVVVAAAVLFGGGAFLFTQLFSGHIKSPDDYEKMTLTPGSYTSTVDCTGEIRAAKSSSVSPEVSGTISKVLVEEGDKVKKGDVLFTIKNSSITKAAQTNRESYEKAAASEQQAYASYQTATSALNAAKKRKQKALAAAQKRQQQEQEAQQQQDEADGETTAQESTQTTTEVTVDASYDEAINAAQSTVDSAKSSYDAAKSNADNAQSTYEAALEQQRLLTVKAGESGTVINVKVEKGMTTANLNAQGAALQIVDLGSLVGVVQVPEESVSTISRGQEATITSDSLPDTKISATVSKIANTPNDSKDKSQGTTYNVTLTIGSHSKAKVGMKINAAIELQDFGTVYYVPDSAVQNNNGLYFVEIIYDDNTTEQHQVTVVGTTDDGQQIIRGDTLNEGTTIRTDLS